LIFAIPSGAEAAAGIAGQWAGACSSFTPAIGFPKTAPLIAAGTGLK
jgi:hypothetical protein